MSALAHSIDAISLGFTDDDYKSDRPEPKTDVFFEWRNSDVKIKRAKSGKHLTLVIKAEALDKNSAAMFPKWINLAVPVSIPTEDIMCPEYSKKMFLSTLRPMFPELGPYDNVEQDAMTGRNVYYKDGEVLQGKAFDIAQMEANRRVGALAADFAKVWMEHGDNASIDKLLERKFFGLLAVSKDGKYVNIAKLSTNPPHDQSVIYDRKGAFKPK